MSSQLAEALKQLQHHEWLQTHDQMRPGSRPTPKQQELLDAILGCKTRYIECRSGNRSGKTLTMSKALAVMLREDALDTWKRPAHWVGPLLLLVQGRQSKQVDESIWPKIRMHLVEGTYKEVRIGQSLQKVVMTNGNTLLTFSHNNVNMAQQAIQSFDANLCVIDELPSHPSLIEESFQRIVLKKGSLVLTYTPKQPAPLVKAFMEALPDDLITRIRLSSLDNPAVDAATREAMIAAAAAQGQHALNTILYGEWMVGTNAVYNFNPDTSVRPLPEHYNAAHWRHVASVDPAISSATGIVLLAEDPKTGHWYAVHSSHVTDIKDPADVVRAVEARLRGYHVVRRIYDAACPWFAGAARPLGYLYTPVEQKSGNKAAWIANVNAKLGRTLFVTPEAEVLQDELASAQWSETAESKIVHSHRFHCADSLSYGLQCLPSFHGEVAAAPLTYHAELRRAHQERRGLAKPEPSDKRVKPGVYSARRR